MDDYVTVWVDAEGNVEVDADVSDSLREIMAVALSEVACTMAGLHCEAIQ